MDQISGARRHIQALGILFWGSIGFEVAPWRPTNRQEWRRRHGQGGGSVEKWKNKIDGGEGLEGGRECSPVV